MKIKKILVVLLIFIYMLTLSPISKANNDGIMLLDSEHDEGYAYRLVQWGSYDSLTDTYPLSYKIFNSTGIHEGVLKIPSSFYNLENCFVYVYKDGRVFFFEYATQSDTIQTCGIYSTYYNYNWVYRLYFKGKRYTYDFETNTLGSVLNISNYLDDNIIFEPNGIIYSKGLNITYSDSQSPLTICMDWQTFKCPELAYMPAGQGAFRLYVNDFYGSTYENEVYTITNGLTGLVLFVYDFKTKTYLTENLNLLSLHDLEQDDQDRYYFDISFEEVLPYLNTIDGDYLIVVSSEITSVKSMEAIQSDNLKARYNFKTLYTSMDYWRYQYYAGSGAGILVPTDADGSPLNPDNPDNPDNPEKPDQTAEALKGLGSDIQNQTNTIKEQTNAINNQTQKIEEQTNSIKEANETNKNIFQKIIELPRINPRWLSQHA